MPNQYQLLTLGCKVNQYETQAIRELLDAHGLVEAPHGTIPDLAIVNTCAVTGEASRKSRQIVRKLATRGRTRVIVVGCAATHSPASFENIAGVEAVISHHQDVTEALLGLLERLCGAPPPPASIGFTPDPVVRAAPSRQTDERNDWRMSPKSVRNLTLSEPFPQLPTRTHETIPLQRPFVKSYPGLVTRIRRFEGHQRAFVKVQDGCDAYCTYCIIPRLRGTPRSKPIETVLSEIRGLVDAGYKEIVLTGVFLGAYGRETAVRKRFSTGQTPLAQLICAIAKTPGLHRLRLSSLEPGDLDESLIAALSTNPVCVPHLHLPLQSGSPDILRRMNRQYTVAGYLATIERVRAALDRPAITADILVGFPGETEADFEATLQVARQAGLADIHAFPFSPRSQTAASRWTGQFIRNDVVRNRLARLASLEADLSIAFRRQFVGERERVIVESGLLRLDGADSGANDHRHGRSDRHFDICFEAPNARPGDIVSVRIDRVTAGRTHGTLVESGRDRIRLPVLDG